MCFVPFADHEAEFDRLLALAAPVLDADPVCSSTSWIVPAARAFVPEAAERTFVGDTGLGAFLEHDHPRGPVLTSFDCLWGFATPLVGPDPVRLVDEFASWLRNQRFHALSISGVVVGGLLDRRLGRLNPVGSTHTAQRCVADLDGDFDAWLGRRSSRFRRSLRKAAKDCDAAGIGFDWHAPEPGCDIGELLARVWAVESQSWKTERDSGLVGTDLGEFTKRMSRRFARFGGLRVGFATLDGGDVGYVIGGRIAQRYRGFQHSFDRAHRSLSLGKAMQFHNIASLAAEGVATYDLGMHMDYKDSYSDRIEASITRIFAKDRLPLS